MDLVYHYEQVLKFEARFCPFDIASSSLWHRKHSHSTGGLLYMGLCFCLIALSAIELSRLVLELEPNTF